MTLSQREKQIAEAEELLGDRLEKAGFAKSLFFGAFANQKLLDYPNLAADQPNHRLCRRAAPVLPGGNRSGGNRSRSLDSAACDRRSGPSRNARRLLAEGVRRPRSDTDPILPVARSAGRPLRQHGPVCECPSFDRPAGDRPVRHAGAAATVSAQARHRRVDQRLCPDRAGSRQRRRQCANHGHANGRRTRLCAQRPKTLDHQRRHRSGVNRHGPHAGCWWRPSRGRQSPRQIGDENHRLPRHARHARLRSGRSPHAQVRRPRHGHRPAGVQEHVRAEGKHSGPARQRAAGRPDGARFRPRDLRRHLHRRGEVLPRNAPPSTPTPASNSASRSARSNWSKKSSPT